MKILITTDLYKPSVNGVVTSVLNLKAELTKLGHEVRILTLNQNDNNLDKDVYYVKSISASKIYPSARIIIGLGNAVIKEIVNWHPDVIHSQCEFSTYILARRIAKKLNIPIIHTYHTVYEDYTNYFSPSYNMGKKAVKIFSKAVLNHTKAVIAPTEKVKELLENYGVKKPIYVIPTGIDLDNVEREIAHKEIDENKSKYGIKTSDKVLIYLGRLAKEKNIDELISYFAKLNKDNFKMLIVGDGPERSKLEEYTKSLNLDDKIIYTGQVSIKNKSMEVSRKVAGKFSKEVFAKNILGVYERAINKITA